MDDIYIVCSSQNIHSAFNLVKSVLKRFCNVDINLGKLGAWNSGTDIMPDNLHVLGENIWRNALVLPERGLKVVGTPIGTKKFIEIHTEKYVQRR